MVFGMPMKRYAAAVILFASLAACSGERADEEAVAHVDQPFANNLNGEAVHEAITSDALDFLKPDIVDWLKAFNVLADVDFALAPSYHFDGCNFMEAAERLRQQQEIAVRYLEPSAYGSANALRALRAFATSLHTAQDFYSHSNWIELGQTVIVDDSHGPWSDFAPYALGDSTGVVVVEGPRPAGVTVLRNPGAGFPGDRVVTVRRGSRTWRGLVSGVFLQAQSKCPGGPASMSHDFLNKDKSHDENGTPRLGHQQAKALATAQTTHEWCRLVAMVRADYDEDWVLYDNWVEDQVEARCGDEVDLVVAGDTFPPSSEPLQAGTTKLYQFTFQNLGPGDAYGMTWEASFSGRVSGLGAATLSTPSATYSCATSDSTIGCRVPGTLPAGATVTVEVPVDAGSPGTMSVDVKVGSHHPDGFPDNDQATLQFAVACPSDAPLWDGSQCVTCASVDPNLPVWNGQQCEACPAGQSWDGTSCLTPDIVCPSVSGSVTATGNWNWTQESASFVVSPSSPSASGSLSSTSGGSSASHSYQLTLSQSVGRCQLQLTFTSSAGGADVIRFPSGGSAMPSHSAVLSIGRGPSTATCRVTTMQRTVDGTTACSADDWSDHSRVDARSIYFSGQIHQSLIVWNDGGSATMSAVFDL